MNSIIQGTQLSSTAKVFFFLFTIPESIHTLKREESYSLNTSRKKQKLNTNEYLRLSIYPHGPLTCQLVGLSPRIKTQHFRMEANPLASGDNPCWVIELKFCLSKILIYDDYNPQYHA